MLGPNLCSRQYNKISVNATSQWGNSAFKQGHRERKPIGIWPFCCINRLIMLTVMSPQHLYLVWPHSANEKSMHATLHAPLQGPPPSWAKCDPRLETSKPQFWHSGRKWGHPYLGPRPLFRPKYAQWHCPGHKRPSPRKACYHGEARSSVGGWGFHSAPPGPVFYLLSWVK